MIFSKKYYLKIFLKGVINLLPNFKIFQKLSMVSLNDKSCNTIYWECHPRIVVEKTNLFYIVYAIVIYWSLYIFQNKYFLPRTWKSWVSNEMWNHVPISVRPCWSQHIIAHTEANTDMQACQKLRKRLAQKCARPSEVSSLW